MTHFKSRMKEGGSLKRILILAGWMAVGGAWAVDLPEYWKGRMTFGGGVGMTFDCWGEGAGRLRMEQVGGARKKTWLDDGKVAYEIEPISKTAEKKDKGSTPLMIPRALVTPFVYGGAPNPLPAAIEGGLEPVAGVTCTVHSYEVDVPGRGKTSVKEWKSPEGFALKSSVKGPSSLEVTWSNFEARPSHEAGRFELPQGARVVKMLVKGDPAPDFTLKTIDGVPVTLSDYFGKKPVLVNLFGTWCGPCRKEIPGFLKVYQEMKGQVEVLMVAFEKGDPRLTIPNFQKEFGIPWPILPHVRSSGVEYLYYSEGRGRVPRSAVIGLDGKVLFYIDGGVIEEDKLRSLFQEALAQKVPGDPNPPLPSPE